MPYIEGRTVHDADSHIMETPEWLFEHADPDIRERLQPLSLAGGTGQDTFVDGLLAKHADPAFRAQDEAEIMLRKNWKATGSFLAEDRPRALDLLGVSSQLVFNTFQNGMLLRAEHGADLDFAYGLARAHNRSLATFCSVDRRLFPTGYVPLTDFERARVLAEENIALGCAALLIASRCPKGHSPSHVGLDPLWSVAQDASVPVLFHVGGAGELLDPMYFENGLPAVKDFHGGDENFRSIDHMAIPFQPMITLSTMILDGVLERFPNLKIGVIEQGASWLPGWMRTMDAAVDAYGRHEERLQKLSLRPSEYVRRQIRVTPYPTEDVAWILEQAGPETVLFSTDYPHVEGGRNPLGRFERSLAGVADDRQEGFWRINFEDLMGEQMRRIRP